MESVKEKLYSRDKIMKFDNQYEDEKIWSNKIN
jgi:hypothetical protein